MLNCFKSFDEKLQNSLTVVIPYKVGSKMFLTRYEHDEHLDLKRN